VNLGTDGSPGRTGYGTALPLEAFLEDAQNLSAEDFESSHGSGFLLLTATRIGSPKDSYSTDVQLLSDDDDASAHTGSLSTLVFPLRSALHIVTVGRASGNDVVIPDPSVSRRHALLKRSERGVFLMVDAGSSNGTTVNGQSVLARGHGPPSQLKTGDDVHLGRVACTFVDAPALRDFVIQTA
jgi:hypothetical protein